MQKIKAIFIILTKGNFSTGSECKFSEKEGRATLWRKQ